MLIITYVINQVQIRHKKNDDRLIDDNRRY